MRHIFESGLVERSITVHPEQNMNVWTQTKHQNTCWKNFGFSFQLCVLRQHCYGQGTNTTWLESGTVQCSVSTNTAGNCPDVSGTLSSDVTLTNVDTQLKLQSLAWQLLPPPVTQTPPPPEVRVRSWTHNVAMQKLYRSVKWRVGCWTTFHHDPSCSCWDVTHRQMLASASLCDDC